jgi:hypothetical protein
VGQSRSGPHLLVNQGGRGKGRWARDQNQIKFELFQTGSNSFKLHLIQLGPSRAQKFEIKYGFEGFEERNIFFHRNFFRFDVDFE